MEEISEFQIKSEERQGWSSIALVWSGSVISVPALMVGGIMGGGLPLNICVVGILIGYVIVCSYMSMIGMQGCDTGLPTAVLAAGALGEKGGRYIISFILAVACIGWFGIQAGVCGTSFAAMFGNLTGIVIPVWISSAIWGGIMLLSACFRFDGLKRLNRIAVPLLAVVCLYTLIKSLGNGGVEVLRSYIPTGSITIVDVISMTVGHFALAGAISSNYCRFARKRTDVIKSSFIGVIPAGLMILLVGAVLSITMGTYNISEILIASGLPWLALIGLVVTSWTTNVANAYSGGLSLAVLLNKDEEKSRGTTAIAGILGTVLAALGILTGLRTFLSLLTALVPPLVGPMIADYWIINRGRVSHFKSRQGFYMPGITAFAAGALTACVTGGIFSKITFLSFLDRPFFIGPINGIVVAMVVYMVMSLIYKGERK